MTKTHATLLDKDNSVVIFIDHQPQMGFGVASIDRQLLKNNTIALARAARIFNVPTIVTAIASESFSGYVWPELLGALEGQKPIERTSMNSWEDPKFVEAVKKTGRKRLVMAALWTEVCLCFPVLSALADGYDVYFVEDASGGSSVAAHTMAVQRMIQAGAIPLTWQQYLLELQRDWNRKDTYDQVLELIKDHGGAYGMGVDYVETILYKKPQRKAHIHPAAKKVA